jgi:hypothetical protein
MQDTYQDSDYGTNRAVIAQYLVLATASVLGWDVELAEFQGGQFILYRAKTWQGRQPRFALTCGDMGFLQALQDLNKLGVCKGMATVTLANDNAIWITGGVGPIPPHNFEKVVLWLELTE